VCDELNLEIDLTDPCQVDAALAELDARLASDGANADLLVAMSQLLEVKGQLEQAIEAMQFAALLDATSIPKLIRLGDLLIKAGEPAAAEDVYAQLHNLAPECSNALVGMAQALSDQGRMEEALIHAERAVRIDPQQPLTHEIHGLVLAQLGRMQEAIAAFSTGLELDPSSANHHAYRGMARLSCLQLTDAWEDFSWRFESSTGDFRRHQGLPHWDGQPIPTPVLIWREQGIGDEVFYLGWLRYLMSTGQQFVAEVEPRLFPLCQRSLLGATVIPLGGALDGLGITHALPMGSLGKYAAPHLGFTQHLPARYLQSDPVTTIRFAEQIEEQRTVAAPVLRIGLAWKSIRARVGSFKSIDLSSFLTLGMDKRLQLVNLQYDTSIEELASFNKQVKHPMLDFPIDKRNDIDSLASLIDACDLVITVSNVTAHLACALGKECWVLLPAGRGLIWYWHHTINNSPWYPSATLFRQQSITSWEDVLGKVFDALAQRCQEKTPPMVG
jgi:tetratricopeptide (TPR) repeat protein